MKNDKQMNDRAQYADIADHLEALAAKNDDASSIREKAQIEADLEDYCYSNLRTIIAGLRIASRS